MRPAVLVHLLDEVTKHLLGHVEVGDHAVLERTNRLDRPRRAAEHPLGLDADGVDLVRARVDRDDRRLGQHDAATADVDERVRRAEVDRHVAAAEAGELREDSHALSRPRTPGRPLTRWGGSASGARPAAVYRSPIWAPERKLSPQVTDFPSTGDQLPATARSERGDRQPDDVEVVAVDALDERAAAALDRVAAGAAAPLARTSTYQSTVASSSVRNVTRVDRVPARLPPPVSIAKPLTTSCVRPLSRRSDCRGRAASAGLPQIAPSITTTVSTPRTDGLVRIAGAGTCAARALRSAFRVATSIGAPAIVLVDVASAATSNSHPSDARMSRRWGEADARSAARRAQRRDPGVGRAPRSQVREEQLRLARRRLGAVGAVDHVLADLDREVAADRARRGLERVRRADHLARRLDRVVALEDDRHERAGGDELDELAEERLALVLAVVLLRGRLVELHLLQRDEPQALALEAGDDLAGQVAGERVRLDQDEGPVHSAPSEGWVRTRASRRGAGSSASAGSSRRRRRARGGGGWIAPGTSVSQYGQIAHCGSSGVAHATHGSLSLRRHAGQRRKSFSIGASQFGHIMLVELVDPSRRRLHLELALAHVLEVLRRPHDRVDDRADEREQARCGRAADQHRIGHPPARVGVGPVDQREPDRRPGRFRLTLVSRRMSFSR